MRRHILGMVGLLPLGLITVTSFTVDDWQFWAIGLAAAWLVSAIDVARGG